MDPEKQQKSQVLIVKKMHNYQTIIKQSVVSTFPFMFSKAFSLQVIKKLDYMVMTEL